MVLLIIPEFKDFLSIKLNKTISIQNFEEGDNIPLNIEIDFPEISCQSGLISGFYCNRNSKW